MIVIITFPELDKGGLPTGRQLVSHGVDMDTLVDVTLPQCPVEEAGVYSHTLGEWVC